MSSAEYDEETMLYGKKKKKKTGYNKLESRIDSNIYLGDIE